jgi:hypothetical protein
MLSSLAPVPTFVLAGDSNDVLDCPSAETAWGHNKDNNPEMFSFIEDHILFLSVSFDE